MRSVYIHLSRRRNKIIYMVSWCMHLHRPAAQFEGVLEPFFQREALRVLRLEGGFSASKEVGKPFATAGKPATCGV